MQANDRFLKSTFNRYLIPTMLSALGGTINVFFDGIIVGQRFSKDGLAAVSLSMPIYLILCTVGALISAGCSIISSRLIGQNNAKKSKQFFNTGVLLSVILGIALSIIGMIFIDPIASFLCGKNDVLEMVKPYAFITIAGGLPKLLLYIPFYYLRLEGKNKRLSFIMLLMTAVNILLDLVFLFPLNMGISGAALASVIATSLAAILGFVFLSSKNTNFRFSFSFVRIRDILGILKVGSPSALNNLLSAFRILCLNMICLSFGGTASVSIFAVINNVSEFSLCIINGIPQTAAPIIGVFDSEKNNTGIFILMKRQVKLGTIFTIIFGAVVTVFSAVIGAFFGVSEPLFVPMLLFSISLPFAQLNSIMTYFFNCSGKILLSNIITTSRILLIPVAAALVISYTALPIWLFFPASEILTICIWVFICLCLSKSKTNLTRILLLDTTLDKSGNISDFSVKANENDICMASEKIVDFCEKNDLSPKQTMQISLAIEEIMTVMLSRCLNNDNNETFDVRAFATEKRIGIRLRCAGREYNLLEEAKKPCNAEELMGITMIVNMAKTVEWQRTFGINTILILI